MRELILTIVALAFVSSIALASTPRGDELRAAALREGHWVRLKGEASDDGDLMVSSVELKAAEKYETLIGTVSANERDWGRFQFLGIPVTVSERVASEGLPASSPAGLRIKVEGRYRGPRKFSAREIKRRGAGRDSVEGRIDRVESTAGGIRLFVMNTVAFVPNELVVECDVPHETLQLIPPRGNSALDVAGRPNVTDEEDDIPETIFLTENLALGGQFETRATFEDELDLDETTPEDRNDYEVSTRLRLRWVSSDAFQVLATYRHRELWRVDDDDGRSQNGNGRLSETYAWWRRAFGTNLDLFVGRQDFDDRREWIYDQDLDAVRVVWSQPRFRADLSASTTLSNGSPRDEDTTNLIAYVSNNDKDRHLAAYVVDRRDDSPNDDSPIHFGVRALGEWLEGHSSWVDFSVVRGFRGDVDLDGYAWDVGTTWAPDFLGPFNVTAGWAFARGDDPSTPDKDEGFVQTGFQDNNSTLGGITSFRYYGEVLDPELSNLSVLTLGVGARLARRTSVDLVWHAYRQDVAANVLRNTDLDRRPSGSNRDIGTELDLVLGVREWKFLDVEVTAGWFDPGSAFPGADGAFVGKVQLRFKF